VRHMKLVHNVDENEMETDVDSEDEMAGAVHVDGFLEPIKIRRGWRGDDARNNPSPKRRRGRPRKRQRATGEDASGDEDVDMVYET
jgi:hypothetical protein